MANCKLCTINTPSKVELLGLSAVRLPEVIEGCGRVRTDLAAESERGFPV